MIAKEKANELVQLFYNNQCSHSVTELAYKSAKKCALICVDEILQTIPEEVMSYKPFMMNTDYWKEVKQEIINYEIKR